MSSLLAGTAIGALGGGLAVTVLAPLTAANNFLGSYFFGSGMILGERQMYQDDWIKIKKRLDAGESFLVILEEVMKPNTQAVMQMARETVIAVSSEWNKIVLDYLLSLPKWLLEMLNVDTSGVTADTLLGGDTTTTTTTGDTGATTTTELKIDWSTKSQQEVTNHAKTLTKQQIGKFLVLLHKQGASTGIQAAVLEIYRSKKVTNLTGTTPVPWEQIAGNVGVSTAATKTYYSAAVKLLEYNKTRQIYLTSQNPQIKANRKTLLASIDKQRQAMFNVMASMQQQYPQILIAFKAFVENRNEELLFKGIKPF